MKITRLNGDVLEGTPLELAEYQKIVAAKQQLYQLPVQTIPILFVGIDYAKEEDKSTEKENKPN